MLTLNASTSVGGWVSLWVFLWSYSIIQCLVYDIDSIETICMLYRNYIYVCIYVYIYIEYRVTACCEGRGGLLP